MKKILLLFFTVMLLAPAMKAQLTASDELAVGLRFQKTEQLYWENGVGLDYTSDFLVKKQIHLKMSYATSRLGSAMIGNAVKQDNFLVGADWRFRAQKPFQIFAGLNTGFFHADMENSTFNVLPHNSMLLSGEAGLYYKFKFPLAASLSVGYNLINGDGVSKPGTLFPVFYQLSVLYVIPVVRGKQ
ncbi:MAG: hypothetical protein QM800_02080 [Paludibacter sp.]